jgi:hypothetical protein
MYYIYIDLKGKNEEEKEEKNEYLAILLVFLVFNCLVHVFLLHHQMIVLDERNMKPELKDLILLPERARLEKHHQNLRGRRRGL